MYTTLSIDNPSNLVFGRAPHPVTTRRGLVIGGGVVYPELNFTMPPTKITLGTLPALRTEYASIVRGALERALALESPGVIFEFETLIEMTQEPKIGVELTAAMNEVCEEYFQRHGLKSEIRLTPNDIRDFERPPRQRTSALLEKMLQLFDEGAKAGGDLLSIESTGGKEVCDDGLMMCNFREVIFALSVLGVRDMKMLWEKIVAIARSNGKIPGGDTACGFGNTAMVLAEKGYIPKVAAAVVRVATAPRTLVACEMGALGPDKDCGYEGPFLKAIAGIPISMEGKTSACAHSSPLGNIAAACADLWSNESVQNIKLLAGMAPTVYMEQLEYDARLMNQAIGKGDASVRTLQGLFVDSDCWHDPQALILAPENVIAISKELINGTTYIERTVNGCLKALDIIETAVNEKRLKMPDSEAGWIERLREEISTIPGDESAFVEEMLPQLEGKFIPSEYGL
ncbi:MAG: methyltransferase MtaB domain-containing protein [Acidobacteriota bacterium]